MGRIAAVLAVALILAGAVGTVTATWSGLRARVMYVEACGVASPPTGDACAPLDSELHAWEALGFLSVMAVVVGLMSMLVQVYPRHPRPGWTHWYGARGKRWT